MRYGSIKETKKPSKKAMATVAGVGLAVGTCLALLAVAERAPVKFFSAHNAPAPKVPARPILSSRLPPGADCTITYAGGYFPLYEDDDCEDGYRCSSGDDAALDRNGNTDIPPGTCRKILKTGDSCTYESTCMRHPNPDDDECKDANFDLCEEWGCVDGKCTDGSNGAHCLNHKDCQEINHGRGDHHAVCWGASSIPYWKSWGKHAYNPKAYCSDGKVGNICGQSSDCIFEVCIDDDGDGHKTCMSGEDNSYCNQGSDCRNRDHGVCRNHKCQTGRDGASCGQEKDCNDGFSCKDHTCGWPCLTDWQGTCRKD